MGEPRIEDAIAHLKTAKDALTLEAYRGAGLHDMQPVDHFTIAEELKRIDSALGPRGKSMFASMAESVIEAYVEILAALRALDKERG